ncbi:polyketide cyclase [Chloroflexia bacterium SDU3-3]|nr:polyketide cyclase [Chloroflexia bacterium SDU3-3]
MNETTTWSTTYSQKIAAQPEAIWALLSDVATWKLWNAGVGNVEIAGTFASGTWFAMTLPDGELIRSQLIEVQHARHFTDETWMGETAVRVEHRIEALPAGGCQVSFAAQAQGPNAAEAGAGASADFPEVLAALAAYIEQGELR